MSFQIENIKEIMDDLDLTALFPKIEDVLAFVSQFTRWAVMVGPLVLLGLGLYYFLAAPKEANYRSGYRFRWGMGSVEAWQFTQRLAGMVWMALGLVLTVVMAIVTLGFGELSSMEMLWEAVECLLWELGIVCLSCIVINTIVFSRFDRKGNRRLTWKELFTA